MVELCVARRRYKEAGVMEVQVFKFGGASVKNAEAALNVVSIMQKYKDAKLVVVVSAMDKITNALEELVDAYFNHPHKTNEIFSGIKAFHATILQKLFKP